VELKSKADFKVLVYHYFFKAIMLATIIVMYFEPY